MARAGWQMAHSATNTVRNLFAFIDRWGWRAAEIANRSLAASALVVKGEPWKNEAYPTALKVEPIRHVMAGARLAPAAYRRRQKHSPSALEGWDDAGATGGKGGGGFAVAPAD